MISVTPSPYLVPFDGSFSVPNASSTPLEEMSKKQSRKALGKTLDELSALQRVFYANDTYSLLLVFQAMDAAGKDGTIRAVMTGVNPAGCQVYAFKKPSDEELDHDFLWRSARSLPERGRIGIFNRSYYEETLVARVHQSILDNQKLPVTTDFKNIWANRYESIRDHEKHLARNGTIVLKFWLNVSKEEQKNRFLARIDNPEKNWKFSSSDIRERGHWDSYMNVYESVLNETSRPWAPWYAIPADNKAYMRMTVAGIIRDTLQSLGLSFPELSEDEQARLQEMRDMLINESS